MLGTLVTFTGKKHLSLKTLLTKTLNSIVLRITKKTENADRVFFLARLVVTSEHNFGKINKNNNQ